MSSPYSVLGNRPIDQWKVTELKEELRRRKLPMKGLKEDLVKRLDEAIRSERETCIDFGNGFITNSNPPFEQKDAKINFMENQKVEDGRETILNDVDKAANDDVSMAVVDSGTAGTDGVIKEKDGKSGTGMQAQTEESDQGVNAQVGDFKQVMKPQDGESSQVTKAQDGESYQVMKAQDVGCVQTGVNEESGKGVNDPDVESKQGTEICDKEFDSGTKSYDGSLRGGAESGQMVVESAIPAITSETGGTDSQSVLTQLESNEPESRCDKTQEEDEESKPPVKDDKSNMPNPNNQVSEVCHVLEFQVKCESISTVSVSINEKNELKDNLNVDNFHLETEVKSDMVEQSSSGVPAIGGDVHSVGDQEPSENLGSREEADDTIAAKESLSKKNDSADVGSEKLNLDRSSGDDSMEEDVLDSKQIDSKHNSDEAVDRSRTVQSHEVKEGISIALVTGSSPDKGDSLVEMKNITEMTEKRKLGDYYEKGQTNEPTKRQRRWNLATVKVPEPQSANLTPSSMPSDVLQSTNLTHSGTPRDAPQSTNLTLSSTPRDVPQSTNLTPSSTPRDVPQTVKKQPFTRSDSTSNGDAPKERVVPPSPKTPTTSLRIDRFLRPFTLKAVQELLAKTGNVCSFWMDHIKTHCYVTYSSVEEAVATRNAVYNLQWPPNGGRLLTAEFVSPQEVQVHVEAPPVSPAPISPSPNAAPSAPPVQLSPHQHIPRQQLPPPPLPPPPPLSDPPPVREHQHIPQPPPKQPDAPIVTLDDLFRKTKATPRIYYLPLSEEQVAAKLAAQGRNTKQ